MIPTASQSNQYIGKSFQGRSSLARSKISQDLCCTIGIRHRIEGREANKLVAEHSHRQGLEADAGRCPFLGQTKAQAGLVVVGLLGAVDEVEIQVELLALQPYGDVDEQLAGGGVWERSKLRIGRGLELAGQVSARVGGRAAVEAVHAYRVET